ncbi:altered inheritance of mitochondria protein 44-like [Chelonus insularis]|uniref:altered inheritance of mitochondria protein 44-like n=1 Tax=Chelonus insularis TaxID=460826 RepID=UPI00158A945A|nr:altered inheritance of mitochondria protein 44-like [Chelonus insularis]XP_034940595.1 altered inheritance of mitochondria protein 44-like [Chelonus insularis]
MSKRTPKALLSKENLRKKSMMTVRRKTDVIDSSFFPELSPTRKSPWPAIETASSSTDINSRATSFSWPEEIEEAATRKVLDLWHAVERTLYNENEPVPVGDVVEECNQWKAQIPHYRIVGKSMTLEAEDTETVTNNEEKDNFSPLKSSDVQSSEDVFFQKSSNDSSKNQHLLHEKREQVIDRIIEYIYGELEKNYDGNDLLNKNLDEVLKITPAPTYSGRKNGRGTIINKSNSRKSSANMFQSFQLTERICNSTASSKALKYNKNANSNSIIIGDDDGVDDNNVDDTNDDDDNDDDDDDDNDVEVKLERHEKTPQHGRNKLGTVFNKKVVVSPVPFAVSTRESFCTLQTTPIRYAGHLLELSTPHGFGRNMNSASKLQSKRKESPFRTPQRHSAWQAPVCPAIWPKNIRLAPIDPSRLPSSKNRSSFATPAIPQRGRNSLSPISHPLKATKECLNGDEFLEIQGQQLTRSAELNRFKTGWDHGSNTQKSLKKMSKSKIER